MRFKCLPMSLFLFSYLFLCLSFYLSICFSSIAIVLFCVILTIFLSDCCSSIRFNFSFLHLQVIPDEDDVQAFLGEGVFRASYYVAQENLEPVPSGSTLGMLQNIPKIFLISCQQNLDWMGWFQYFLIFPNTSSILH